MKKIMIKIFVFIMIIFPQFYAFAEGNAEIRNDWRGIKDELEKARASVTNEQELAFITKAKTMLKTQDKSLFMEEITRFSGEIKNLEFSALQGTLRTERFADYDSLFFQLDLLASNATSSTELLDRYCMSEAKTNFIGKISDKILLKIAGRDISKIFETDDEISDAKDNAGFIPSGKGAFVMHMADAIKTNSDRRDYYSKKTAGVSRRVSRNLVAMERITLPIAWLVDLMALEFNKTGIPIITGDFISMSLINAPEIPPVFKNMATPDMVVELRSCIDSFKTSIKTSLEDDDFLSIGSAAYSALSKITELENSGRCHFAISKHIVESIGFFALHAIRYAEASQGKTNGLSKLFIRVQALALPFCHNIDTDAQKCHKLGVGILINDVPAIPFKEEWKARFHSSAQHELKLHH
ncbi:MAG TPA: hypothetical protein PKK26_19590 [Candidatus Wallbacteria bacterium]|nr:hypothetical protein [Candidatus Wallbacteria bacterium]